VALRICTSPPTVEATINPWNIWAEVISAGACQIAALLPAFRSSHSVTAVAVACIRVDVPGKMAAASVELELISLARSISSTSGDSLNKAVVEAVEYSRLDALPSALVDDDHVPIPEIQRPHMFDAFQTLNTRDSF